MLSRVFSDREERIVYRILLGCFLAALAAFGILRALHFRPTAELPGCVVRRFTGLYCPGCGMSHSAESLLSLRIFDAFRYHPFFAYAVVFLTIYISANAIGFLAAFLRRRRGARSAASPVLPGENATGAASPVLPGENATGAASPVRPGENATGAASPVLPGEGGQSFVLPIRGIYLWAGLFLLIGNWILRNVLWFGWGIPIY